MGKMTDGANWFIGGIRALIAGFFATIFLLIIFPTVIELAKVLSYGIFMLFYVEFWALLALMTAALGVAGLVAKVILPDISMSG